MHVGQHTILGDRFGTIWTEAREDDRRGREYVRSQSKFQENLTWEAHMGGMGRDRERLRRKWLKKRQDSIIGIPSGGQ